MSPKVRIGNLKEAEVVVQTMQDEIAGLKEQLEALKNGLEMARPDEITRISESVRSDLDGFRTELAAVKAELEKAVNISLAKPAAPPELSWKDGIEMIRRGDPERSREVFTAVNEHLAALGYELDVKERRTVPVAEEIEQSAPEIPTDGWRLITHTEPFPGSSPDGMGGYFRILKPGETI